MVDFEPNGYGIIEEWSFSDAIENGLDVDAKQAYEALGVVTYALQRNPESFPIVHG